MLTLSYGTPLLHAPSLLRHTTRPVTSTSLKAWHAMASPRWSSVVGVCAWMRMGYVQLRNHPQSALKMWPVMWGYLLQLIVLIWQGNTGLNEGWSHKREKDYCTICIYSQIYLQLHIMVKTIHRTAIMSSSLWHLVVCKGRHHLGLLFFLRRVVIFLRCSLQAQHHVVKTLPKRVQVTTTSNISFHAISMHLAAQKQ